MSSYSSSVGCTFPLKVCIDYLYINDRCLLVENEVDKDSDKYNPCKQALRAILVIAVLSGLLS